MQFFSSLTIWSVRERERIINNAIIGYQAANKISFFRDKITPTARTLFLHYNHIAIFQ